MNEANRRGFLKTAAAGIAAASLAVDVLANRRTAPTGCPRGRWARPA